MPQKTCSTMTSLHHSPSTAKGMYPSKAGNWTSLLLARICSECIWINYVLNWRKLKWASWRLHGWTTTFRTTISWSSEANPTAMKLSQRLTQQDGMTDSCPLYLPPSADGEIAHIRWLSLQHDRDSCAILLFASLLTHMTITLIRKNIHWGLDAEKNRVR